MVHDSTSKEEQPEATTESHADTAAMPQPRPTAWVTGGGALRYARPVPDADETTPTADDDDANESEGGLDDDDATTTDSDTESDGDEASCEP